MRDVDRDLLKLLAFSDEEIEEFLPKWEIARKALRLDDATIANAIDHFIPENWDIKYLGVRKLIGAYLREGVEQCMTPTYKAEGKKIVYGILPAISNYYYAVKEAGGDDVFIGFPDHMLVNILNSFFHAAAPWLDIAESYGFTYGCRHCPLNKMRVAAYVENVIAAPDIIWSWGFNCDEGPKTDEMLQGITGKEWKYHVSRAPHDSLLSEKEEDIIARVEYMSEQMKLGVKAISDAIGIEIKPEHVASANKKMRAYGFKVGVLTQLAATADPPVLGGDSVSLAQCIMNVPFNTGTKYAEEAVDILTKGLRAAIKAGEGVMPKGTPKVAIRNLPYCIPWLGQMFRQNGLMVQFACALTQSSRQTQPPTRPDDPWYTAAEAWSRNPMCSNMKNECDSYIEKLKTYNANGMLLGLFDFDRWVGPQQKLQAKMVEETLHIPCFYIEGDFWDDREYSPEALKTRVESICQVFKMRLAALEAEKEAE